MNMNAKHTIVISLFGLATAALVGCGGRAPLASSPGGSNPASADAPGEAPASAGYGQADYGPEGEAPTTPNAPPAAAKSRALGQDEAAPRDSSDPFELTPQQPKHRPGLATRFGESRHSRVTTAPFVRGDRLHPFAVAKLFYNDPQGIAAMSDTLGGTRRHTRRFAVGAGHLEMGIRDGSGRFLTGFVAGGDNYVTGIGGNRYSIVIRNHSPGRIEAVVSVDGLDVIDGKAAAFTKRGYLIDAYGDLDIDGFRTSTSEVAAFRFGSVGESYAARKHCSTRNVGVIGLAVFHERGDSPRHWGTPRTHQDTHRRNTADPFPERYATPPN
jgi:hypothetical protein